MTRKQLRLMFSLIFFTISICLAYTIPHIDEARWEGSAALLILFPFYPLETLLDLATWRFIGILCIAVIAFYLVCSTLKQHWIYCLFILWAISYVTSLWYIRSFEQSVLTLLTIDIRQLGGFCFYFLCAFYVALLLRIMNEPTSHADFNGLLLGSYIFIGDVALKRIIGPNFGRTNGSISQSLSFGLINPLILLLLISSIYLFVNAIRLIRQDSVNVHEVAEL